MKTVIFGIGKSGISAIKLALRFNYPIRVVNSGDPGLWRKSDPVFEQIDPMHCCDQIQAQDFFSWAEVIVKSPGIDPRINELKNIPTSKIISEIEWAWRHYQGDATVISITGSNGKTTTSTMLAQYLEKIGKSVFLGGNIGIPICDFILMNKKVDFIVLELSSFQLENVDKFKTNIGVILNIMENHTERYDHPKDYAKAKFNLINHTTDIMFINDESLYLDHNLAGVELFSSTNKINLPMCLPGEHNRQNAFVVEKILKFLAVDLSKFAQFLLEFKGVEHRLEFVGDFHGLKVYNDSKSTNMIALEAALSGLKGEENFLIISGKPRGGEKLEELLLKYKKHLKKIFSYGQCNKIAPSHVEKFEHLDDVVDELKNAKGVLIFSPGFPSYDLYKNFEERGVEFKKTILAKLSESL